MKWRRYGLLLALAALPGCCCGGGRRSAYYVSSYPQPNPSCSNCQTSGPEPPLRVMPGPLPTGPVPSGLAPAGARLPSGLPPDAGVRLAPPEPLSPDVRSDSARLPPETVEPPPASIPPQTQPKAPPPGVKDSSEEGTPALPAGIPQFAQARPQVATGQQPFRDGVEWLKEHGYRTVLHVREPGEDDTAARDLFKKQGLTYLTLDLSPTTLTRDVVEKFNRTVTDKKNLPLFVYDKDGALAGALWYLYFRLSEGLPDEKARTEAARLGFTQDQDENHKTMWIAVQKYLENLNR